MIRIPRSRTAWMAVALFGLGIPTPAADPAAAKTHRITMDQVTMEAPVSWTEQPPASRMRVLEMTIPRIKGDRKDAQLVGFVFPGGAGGVEANIERWRTMFRDPEGKPPEARITHLKAGTVPITMAEVAGHYVASKRPGSAEKFDEPNYRLIGAIVDFDPDTTYYLKLVGPDRTVAAARPQLEHALRSIKPRAAKSNPDP